MKTCCKCSVLKEDSEFYKKTKSGGLQPYCKPCLLNIQMTRWKKRKEKAIEYKGGSCADCKVCFPRPEVYQFHHLDPTAKDYDWNKLRLMAWETILKELDKCVLLCANCHIIRHSKLLTDYEK